MNFSLHLLLFCKNKHSAAHIFQVLPRDLRENLQNEPRRDQLLEVTVHFSPRPLYHLFENQGNLQSSCVKFCSLWNNFSLGFLEQPQSCLY